MDEDLAENFLAIWQSELTAMAADRELRESWVMMVRLWVQAANAAAVLSPHDPTSGGAIFAQPPRSTSADAASGSGLDGVDELNRRVAELERRLAELLEQRDASATDTKPSV